MFQKCPICEGLARAEFVTCETCLNKRIISCETGRPPQDEPEIQIIPASDKAEDLVTPLSTFEELSEEEIMYWSTPTYDEIQERKELQEKQRKEDETVGRGEVVTALA